MAQAGYVGMTSIRVQSGFQKDNMIQKVYLPDSSGNLLFLPEERPKNEGTFTELDRSDVFSEKLFLTTMEHVSL